MDKFNLFEYYIAWVALYIFAGTDMDTKSRSYTYNRGRGRQNKLMGL